MSVTVAGLELDLFPRRLPAAVVPPRCGQVWWPADQLLAKSFRTIRSTAAFLVGAGFLVAWLPPGVPGFRLVLARGWHGLRLVRDTHRSPEQYQLCLDGLYLMHMNATIVASVIGGLATIIGVLITVIVTQRNGRRQEQREIGLLYGDKKREVYTELQDVIESQMLFLFSRIRPVGSITTGDNRQQEIAQLVTGMRIMSPELYPVAQALRMTLLRLLAGCDDRDAGRYGVTSDDLWNIYRMTAQVLSDNFLELLRLDLRGQLASPQARSIMGNLDAQFHMEFLGLPPPPPLCYRPSWGLR